MPLDMPATPSIAETLEDFFENGAVGLHLVGGDGTILRANRAELELLGYAPEEYVGRPIADFHADPATIKDILERLSRGETLDKYPARLKAKDGSIKHVLISSSVSFDDAGRFRNTRCFTLDVTAKIDAERELQEAQQRLAATYEHALVGIAEVDADGRFLRVNEPFHEITGYTKEQLLARSLFDISHPDDAAKEQARFREQVEGRVERYEIEKRYIHADGRELWVRVASSSVRDAEGRFLYGVRVVHDVSDRRLAEQRNQLLINELNHRVKNTLATVQSLAAQTARSAADMPDFMARFEGRLVALSAAHDRLTRRNWEGASLAEIVQEELAFRWAIGRSPTSGGPDVALPPRMALSLSMAIHELGSNAAKYGALSTPEGRVDVAWTVERDTHSRPLLVRLRWSEHGGPPVAEPVRRGFGSRLLETMAADLDAEAELRFDPEGVRWTIAFPVPREG